MPIEIEKKYRLTKKDRRALEKRMRELGCEPKPIEFEENTIYGGGRLNFGGCALRLRRINGNERAYLTFKRRLPGKSPIKHQEEHEVTVADPDGMDWILNSLEFRPAMERRRNECGILSQSIFKLFQHTSIPWRLYYVSQRRRTVSEDISDNNHIVIALSVVRLQLIDLPSQCRQRTFRIQTG